nr:MAG TPA: hypothetical protein [Caudoviricetes sp.]
MRMQIVCLLFAFCMLSVYICNVLVIPLQR